MYESSNESEKDKKERVKDDDDERGAKDEHNTELQSETSINLTRTLHNLTTRQAIDTHSSDSEVSDRTTHNDSTSKTRL